MPSITEDDIYRASTQYRLWSYTQASLASLRATTNAGAAEGVRAAIKSQASNDGRQATAVQYLKRFYLSNSPMTYHPKEMMPSALFLATKTENNYISAEKFAEKLPKTTAEDLIAPEFILTQGLRFTFDVRHPLRGLEGGLIELLALANGTGQPGSGSTATAAKLQNDMMTIGLKAKKGEASRSTDELVYYIKKSADNAKDILKTSALLSDAYLLYSPSQIWLSSLFLADEPLARFYIDTKFPTPSSMKPKLLITLEACVQLLRKSPSAKPGEEEMKELMRIDKKLYKCRNPEKIDLLGINRAQKREGGEEGLDDKVAKKRKLEREKSEKEAEDVFGPPLGLK
ncbi:cyclin H, partial [Lecanoromycetidae sp. Uapishka_2]